MGLLDSKRHLFFSVHRSEGRVMTAKGGKWDREEKTVLENF